MAHDVFISHSSKDKNIADAVCSILEQNKIRCWIAPRDIIPGKNYAACITEAIKNSKILVIIFSSNSNVSGPVTNELEIALRHNVIIIPFRIEDVEPSQELEYYLSSRHWLDALNAPIEQYILTLAETIKKFVLIENKTDRTPSYGVEKEKSRENDKNTSSGYTPATPAEEANTSQNVLILKVLTSINPLSLASGSTYVFTIDKNTVIKLIAGSSEVSSVIYLPVGTHDVNLKVYGWEDKNCSNPSYNINKDIMIKKDSITELCADRGGLFRDVYLTTNYKEFKST